MKAKRIQTLIEAIYPPQCLLCDARTTEDFALCGSCWGETPFITGAVCHHCGVPVLSDASDRGELLCDDCIASPRPWVAGRAAMTYTENARRIVMGLKHGDRLDVARAAAPWLQRAARPVWPEDPVLIPVPLHPRRLLQRRFNQSAVLAQHLARRTGAAFAPDALLRTRRTRPLEGHSREERFTELAGAVAVNQMRLAEWRGMTPVLVDDVMTSGATLATCTEALKAAGAERVVTVVLARVQKGA